MEAMGDVTGAARAAMEVADPTHQRQADHSTSAMRQLARIGPLFVPRVRERA